MATEIGSPFDWTEFYWGGFQPQKIGAVPLYDAFSNDESSKINQILDMTRVKLKDALKSEEYTKKEIKFKDYFVTIHDEYEDAENESKNNQIIQKKKKQHNEITIVRLWHKNVFIGVRRSGKANPGQFNFLARFYAKTAEFKSFEKWQQ